MTGPGRALDPGKYCIVIPNHFGGSVSSSPSNCPAPFDRSRFPHVTNYDNVVAQHRLLTEELGIASIRLATSCSMGACQVYHWAALHPDMVSAIAPIVGAARTCIFNKVFLAAVRSAILSDADWNNGYYGEKPPVRGLRHLGRVYAGWGFSEAFYRREVFKSAFGAESLEEFLTEFWESLFLKCDANDLLAQVWTWEHNDISAHPRFQGDFEKALGQSAPRAIILPGSTDVYFPPIDSEYEAKHMPAAESRPVPSIWGHMCSINPDDQKFIDQALSELLG